MFIYMHSNDLQIYLYFSCLPIRYGTYLCFQCPLSTLQQLLSVYRAHNACVTLGDYGVADGDDDENDDADVPWRERKVSALH